MGASGCHSGRAQWLVFDIGGTSIRGAVYDPEEDAVTAQAGASTQSSWGSPDTPPGRLLEGLVEDLRTVGAAVVEDPAVVSIGFPGPVDAHGHLLAAPTVLGRRAGAMALRQMLEEAWPAARVLLINDVTAAGFGVASHDDSFCVVTVGSGVGCKVFLDGRPIVGPAARGGEIGHFRVDRSPEANRCECGDRGHLGAIASGRGALLTARRRAPERHDLTCEELVATFQAGDPFAREVIGQGAAALGTSLAALHTALGLERFVLVGGFANALGEGYRRLVACAAAASCWDLGQDWDRMVEGDPLDGLSGLLGAGRYARATLATPVLA